MPKISEEFAGNFFHTDQIPIDGIDKVIESCDYEDVGKDSKLVLRFKGEELGLPLNKTNANRIAEVFGDDTDNWTGKPVRLYRAKTDYNGRRVSCIRVSADGEMKSDSDSGSGSGSGRNSDSGSRKGKKQQADIPF